MCIWFAQMCEECNRITAIPWKQPIECHLRCDRLICDLDDLTEKERILYLDYTGVCSKHCDFKNCGVYVRVVRCGHEYALSKVCKTNRCSDEQ